MSKGMDNAISDRIRNVRYEGIKVAFDFAGRCGQEKITVRETPELGELMQTNKEAARHLIALLFDTQLRNLI